MHLNNQYVRKGPIEPEKLFVKEDITKEVDEIVDKVPKRVKEMLKIIQMKEEPDVKVGEHCTSYYGCPIEGCFDFLPENNVLNLYRIQKKKAYQMMEDGIHRIADIPEDIQLTTNQEIQRKCAKTGKTNIEKDKIKDFLESLQCPLYFMDFESFQVAIPLFDGSRPYQQIVFQFSVYVVQKEGTEPKHISFVHDGKDDPRPKFAEELKIALGNEGSVIVFSRAFELGRLNELAKDFPKYKNWVESVKERIIDLYEPFGKFYYYHPEQYGKAGLKTILPLVTGNDYSDLDIYEGGMASRAYLTMTYDEIPDQQKKKIMDDLKQYCGRDTEGMIWIVEELEKLSNK